MSNFCIQGWGVQLLWAWFGRSGSVPQTAVSLLFNILCQRTQNSARDDIIEFFLSHAVVTIFSACGKP